MEQYVHYNDATKLIVYNEQSFAEVPKPLAWYPLNSITKGRDVTRNRNPTGRVYKLRQSPGPDGLPNGAYKFPGRKGSFIYIPNRRKLDTVNSITIAMWVKPERAGPLFHYRPRRWGVHVWMTRSNELFARFVPRSRKPIKFIRSRQVNTTRY